jgi:hypothetical protein
MSGNPKPPRHDEHGMPHGTMLGSDSLGGDGIHEFEPRTGSRVSQFVGNHYGMTKLTKLTEF